MFEDSILRASISLTEPYSIYCIAVTVLETVTINSSICKLHGIGSSISPPDQARSRPSSSGRSSSKRTPTARAQKSHPRVAMVRSRWHRHKVAPFQALQAPLRISQHIRPGRLPDDDALLPETPALSPIIITEEQRAGICPTLALQHCSSFLFFR